MRTDSNIAPETDESPMWVQGLRRVGHLPSVGYLANVNSFSSFQFGATSFTRSSKPTWVRVAGWSAGREHDTAQPFLYPQGGSWRVQEDRAGLANKVGPEGLVDRILGAEGNGRFSGGQGLGKGTTRDWWLGLTSTGS